jgi:hypothetical protein
VAENGVAPCVGSGVSRQHSVAQSCTELRQPIGSEERRRFWSEVCCVSGSNGWTREMKLNEMHTFVTS